MNRHKIFNDDLVAITFEPQKIYWTKPTIVGATNLDLLTQHMHWLRTKYMKGKFKTLVFFSDTDSLIYKVESEHLYEDLTSKDAIHQEYDFSNYNKDNRLYSKHRKLEAFKFKDEMRGKIKHNIVALKSEFSSISMGNKRKLPGKGTTKSEQKSLKHSALVRILAKSALLETLNYTKSSEKQNLFTLQTMKTSLSCFDEERFFLPNAVDTLPSGQYSLLSGRCNVLGS